MDESEGGVKGNGVGREEMKKGRDRYKGWEGRKGEATLREKERERKKKKTL